MKVEKYRTKVEMGEAAARRTAEILNRAAKARGEAAIILATGISQFEMLQVLVKTKVDWSRVTGFHLDEYIGLPAMHPAGFRKYLKERFVDKVPALKGFHFVDGEAADSAAECKRLSDLIGRFRIDVACVGIGENGHLAFNDPPADFETKEPFIVVELDEACRRQQLGEGWFKRLEDVPRKAITMSISQIMKSDTIICTVPDKRKAEAVKNSLEGGVSNMVPASIMQNHPDCTLFLDNESASLLKGTSP